MACTNYITSSDPIVSGACVQRGTKGLYYDTTTGKYFIKGTSYSGMTLEAGQLKADELWKARLIAEHGGSVTCKTVQAGNSTISLCYTPDWYYYDPGLSAMQPVSSYLKNLILGGQPVSSSSPSQIVMGGELLQNQLYGYTTTASSGYQAAQSAGGTVGAGGSAVATAAAATSVSSQASGASQSAVIDYKAVLQQAETYAANLGVGTGPLGVSWLWWGAGLAALLWFRGGRR